MASLLLSQRFPPPHKACKTTHACTIRSRIYPEESQMHCDYIPLQILVGFHITRLFEVIGLHCSREESNPPSNLFANLLEYCKLYELTILNKQKCISFAHLYSNMILPCGNRAQTEIVKAAARSVQVSSCLSSCATEACIRIATGASTARFIQFNCKTIIVDCSGHFLAAIPRFSIQI
jgi:hypothetical protein